jgi:hypothetical protein
MDGNTNTLLAIICIGIMGLACISENINGQILALAIIAIAGLGGYEVYKKVKEVAEV